MQSLGQNLKAFQEAGASVIRGVDGSWVNKDLLMIPSECFTQSDLSQPDLPDKIPEKHFDLTVSTEVAEHLEQQYADTFMDNLAAFSDVILFSAAIPGQGGTHHVNEQWPSYWIAKFRARGFVPVDCIRSRLWHNEDVHSWYKQNLMMFVKESALDKYPALKREAGRRVLDAVHPVLWKARCNAGKLNTSTMGFRPLLRLTASGMLHLIPAFVRAIMKRLHA